MASNALSNRRGVLSRPGVCTPPPPPPPSLALYTLTLDPWLPPPYFPMFSAQLVAKNDEVPPTQAVWWNITTNANLVSFTHNPYPPDHWTIRGDVHAVPDVLYIHATLSAPGANPITYSLFVPIPENF